MTIVPRLALTAALLGVLAIFPPATKQGCPANASEWAYPDCDDGNYITGYWWHSESWVPGLIRNDSQFVNLPPVMRGRAVWYAAGIMEATAEVRGLSLSGYIDGVASMSCADIGQSYWISRMETAPEQPLWEGPFLVVDCPQLDDVYAIIVGREEVVEVGWKTAMRWAVMESEYDPPPGGWQVLASRLAPTDSMPPTVVLSTWFPQRAEFYARALEVTLDPKPLYRNQNGVVSWRIDGQNWVSFSPPGPFRVPVVTATEPRREHPTAGQATATPDRATIPVDHPRRITMNFGDYAVAGVPLIVIIFALVEEIKAYGLTGKILRLVSLAIGLVLTFTYQVALLGQPTDAGGWFTVAVVGLLYGLSASGAYDFLDSRFPPK